TTNGSLILEGNDVADPDDALMPDLPPSFGGLAFDFESPNNVFTADGNGRDDLFRYSTNPAFSASSRTALIRNIFPEYDAGLVDLASPAAIPEPETYALILTGLGVLGWRRGARGAGIATSAIIGRRRE